MCNSDSGNRYGLVDKSAPLLYCFRSGTGYKWGNYLCLAIRYRRWLIFAPRPPPMPVPTRTATSGSGRRLPLLPGLTAMLERIAGNGVRCILVESPDRFARDLIVQMTGHDFLKSLGVSLIPA